MERVVPWPTVPDSPLYPLLLSKGLCTLLFSRLLLPRLLLSSVLQSLRLNLLPKSYFSTNCAVFFNYLTCQPIIMPPIFFVGVGHPLLSKPAFLLSSLRCAGIGILMLSVFALRYPFISDYNQLTLTIKLFYIPLTISHQVCLALECN